MTKQIEANNVDGATVTNSNSNAVSTVSSSYFSRSSRKVINAFLIAALLGVSFVQLSSWRKLKGTYIDVTSTQAGSSSIPVSADEVDSAPGVAHAHARHEHESQSRTESRTRQRTVLITGAAGFVGMHLSTQLMSQGVKVIGLDNLNTNFYPSALKQDRLAQLMNLTSHSAHDTTTDDLFTFVEGDVCDRSLLSRLIVPNNAGAGVESIIHMASQEYVRDDGKVTRPFHYPLNNIDCLVDLLEVLKANQNNSGSGNGTQIANLYYASSSTAYRNGFTVVDNNGNHTAYRNVSGTGTGPPIDEVTAASVQSNMTRSNELVARAYFSLYGISSTAIRLPNIYGAWGRPDMAYYKAFLAAFQHKNSTSDKSDNLEDLIDQQGMLYIDDAVNDILRLVVEENNNKGNVNGAKVHRITPDNLTSTTSKKNKHKQDALDTTLEWFRREDRSKYMSNSSRTEIMVRHALSNMPSVSFSATTVESKSADDLCFVTSMFSQSANQTDEIRDISSYNHSSPFRFFFFTNLPDLVIDGWERVLMKDLPFKRMITSSRWPKFMAWQHPILQTCKVVLYSDANLSPKDVPQHAWEEQIIKHALTTPSGIYQRPNRRVNEKKHLTVVEELIACVKDRKDLKKNVYAQIQWLRQQPDFNNEAFGYWNMFLVYDPNNAKMQELMTTFWAHYSAEDQSWRDQPLYRYLTDKLDIRPKTRNTFLDFFHKKSGKNKRQHKYSAADDHNALVLP
jgi:nucleoside-diphosphate-sugar epimerase